MKYIIDLLLIVGEATILYFIIKFALDTGGI